MEIPPEIRIEVTTLPARLAEIVYQFGLSDSKTQAKQLIEQGGIKINGDKVLDKHYLIEELPPQGVYIQRSNRPKWLFCLQEKFQTDDSDENRMWNTKGSNGDREDTLIDLLIADRTAELRRQFQAARETLLAQVPGIIANQILLLRATASGEYAWVDGTLVPTEFGIEQEMTRLRHGA